MNTEVSTETINAILFNKKIEDGTIIHDGAGTFVQVQADYVGVDGDEVASEEDVTGEGETPAPTVH